jgi:hypothetical protein
MDGDTDDPDDPVLRMAAYLTVNEHGDEPDAVPGWRVRVEDRWLPVR